MKRVISLMLTLAMIFVLAIPCFAATNDDEQIVPYSSSYTSTTDRKGNQYSITCNSTVDGMWCSAYTSYRVTEYGDTSEVPFENIKKTITVSSTLYFNDGFLPQENALSGSKNAYGKADTVQDAGYTAKSVQSINSVHTFDTSVGLVGGKLTYTSAGMPTL